YRYLATQGVVSVTVQPAGAARRSPSASRRRVAKTPLADLEVILNEAGIAQDRFAWAAAAALAELRGAAGAPIDEPATQVADAERRYLEAGGLDLTARRRRDPDPAAESAARYAALLA